VIYELTNSVLDVGVSFFNSSMRLNFSTSLSYHILTSSITLIKACVYVMDDNRIIKPGSAPRASSIDGSSRIACINIYNDDRHNEGGIRIANINK
jgi:hypothetical protein